MSDSIIEVGTIVRTPPMGVSKNTVGQPPAVQHDCEGEVVDGPGADGDYSVDTGEGGNYWWSPEDLTVVGNTDGESNVEDEETDSPTISDVEEGDMIRPVIPADWSYGSTDLREDHFYLVVEAKDDYVAIEDGLGRKTSTERDMAISAVLHQNDFEKGKIVRVSGDAIMTILSNPDDTPGSVFLTGDGSEKIVQADLIDLDPIPEIPVDSVGRDYQVSYNAEEDVFEVGCNDIQPEAIQKLAEWYERLTS